MTVKHPTTDLAYDYCRKIALKHYENFPVGSVLVPKDKRKYIYSIYAFARYADDIADSKELGTGEKVKRLDALGTELSKIEGGAVNEFDPDTNLMFEALSDTVNALEIPLKEFRDLLSAFRQDSEGFHYITFEQLEDYSERSANPIGHLVLNVFGFRRSESERMFQLSDKICTALQLTNFWQDVSEDLKINRIYIPEEIMRKHEYDSGDLKKGTEDHRFKGLIKELCERTHELYEEGNELTEMTKGRLKYELKATVNGGRKILKKISELDYCILSNRPSLSAFEKVSIILKAIL